VDERLTCIIEKLQMATDRGARDR
uniref:Uncharacterized protein n=1 Tax=Myotis lucifugus TaxID=59463 RepID=G1Q5D7_MYOLU